MPATPLRRAVYLVGAFLLFFAVPLRAEDVSRLQQIEDEIAAARANLEKAPEKSREFQKLTKALERLEKERGILQRRQVLEARASARSRLSQEKPAQRLEAALRNLEVNPAPLQARRDKIVDQIRVAVAKKETLLKARTNLQAQAVTPDRDAALGLLAEQLVNANEELESLQLQREAVDRRLELVREAEAVAKRLADEPTAPELQVRLWFERKRELAERLRRQAEVGEDNLDLGEKRTNAEEKVAVTRESLAGFDEEIKFRTPQGGGLFREADKAGEALLAAAKRARETMLARLPAVEGQLASLEEAQGATLAHVELLRAQIDWLSERQALFTDRLTRWLGWPAAVGAFLVVLFLGISRLILPRLYKQEMLISARRVNRYIMLATVAVALSLFFLDDLRELATALGIVSAALVIALQDVFTSLAGWFALIASRKLRVGDRVEIEGVKGDVLEIELLRTTILEIDNGVTPDHPSGRIVAIPNSFIFRTRVHNATHVHRWIWMKTDILVTFESSQAEAALVLERALHEETAEAFAEARRDAARIENRYGRIDADYRPKLYRTIADSGVNYTLLFIADCHFETEARDRLHRRVLADFAKDPRLQFAYPTTREFGAVDPVVPPTPVPNLPDYPQDHPRRTAPETGGKQLTAWPDAAPNGTAIPPPPKANVERRAPEAG